MLMDPHPSQQHADLQLAVLQLQQEITRPLPEKFELNMGAIRYKHILVSQFTYTLQGIGPKTALGTKIAVCSK